MESYRGANVLNWWSSIIIIKKKLLSLPQKQSRLQPCHKFSLCTAGKYSLICFFCLKEAKRLILNRWYLNPANILCENYRLHLKEFRPKCADKLISNSELFAVSNHLPNAPASFFHIFFHEAGQRILHDRVHLFH